ncbi:S1C family serine protease [Luteolibacter sp. Populi]|uniref:S1C family serine protease n=1 Tax=Luteolibacter sp. Populi TaxID=3230487 RepID=UPI0034654E4A
MNQRFTYGFAALLGLASPVMAIEGPDSLKPVPPALVEDEGDTAPPVEEPRAEQVAPPVDLSRPYLGIGAGELPALLAEHLKLAEGEGAVVHTLDPAGPAAKAGLAQNDIVTKIGGKPVNSHEGLRDVVSDHKPGDEVEIDFIHRGDARSVKLALGKAPAMGPEIAGRGTRPIDRLRLNGMPEDQAQLLRDAIEQNGRAFENWGEDDLDPGSLIHRGMRQRMQQMMRGIEEAQGLAQPGINIGGTSTSTLRIADPNGQGSVEIQSTNGDKTARILGRDGKVQWEGPCNTEEERKKVPEQLRERLDNLNIDWDAEGSGIRLRMNPRARPR